MSKDLSDSENRKKLKKSSFALPEQEKYPIPDIEHARNALARVAQHGSAAEKKQVRAAVEKKYPSLKKDGWAQEATAATSRGQRAAQGPRLVRERPDIRALWHQHAPRAPTKLVGAL